VGTLANANIHKHSKVGSVATILTLLFLCMVLPGIYAIRRSYFQGKVEINHVTLFTVGFLAYWILPIGIVALLSSHVQDYLGDDLMNLYAGAGSMEEYLIFCGIIYLAFVAGDMLGRRKIVRSAGRLKPVSGKILLLFGVMGGIIAAGAMIQARDILLKGTYVHDPDPIERGTVAAACNFLFLPAVIYIVQTNPSTLKRLLFNRYMVLFLPPNIILFLSGSRLYFISFLLMLIVYWTSFRQRIRAARLVAVLLGAITLMGAVGAYRLGGSGEHSIIANLIEEPMFTSFSLAAFLGSHKLFLWNYPVYLASDLINLIPSAVFPGKIALINQMPDVYTPLGALNSFVSFQWNFGLIGTMIFMFLFGYFLTRLRRHCDLWSRVAYVLSSGWLTFTFFRDPFSISLVKNILEFSLLIPAVMIAFSRLVVWAESHYLIRLGD